MILRKPYECICKYDRNRPQQLRSLKDLSVHVHSYREIDGGKRTLFYTVYRFIVNSNCSVCLLHSNRKGIRKTPLILIDSLYIPFHSVFGQSSYFGREPLLWVYRVLVNLRCVFWCPWAYNYRKLICFRSYIKK